MFLTFLECEKLDKQTAPCQFGLKTTVNFVGLGL